jgi:hypothetical protein
MLLGVTPARANREASAMAQPEDRLAMGLRADSIRCQLPRSMRRQA